MYAEMTQVRGRLAIPERLISYYAGESLGHIIASRASRMGRDWRLSSTHN